MPHRARAAAGRVTAAPGRPRRYNPAAHALRG